MKRRAFLRGLLAAPAVAAVASLPLPAPVPQPEAVADPDTFTVALPERDQPTAWSIAPMHPPFDYDAEFARIMRETALENPALIRAVVGRALEDHGW